MLTLPTGLHFDARAARRHGAITTSGPGRVIASSTKVGIRLTFRHPGSRVALTLGSGALTESANLRSALRRLAGHGGHQSLGVQMKATSTSGAVSQKLVTFIVTR